MNNGREPVLKPSGPFGEMLADGTVRPDRGACPLGPSQRGHGHAAFFPSCLSSPAASLTQRHCGNHSGGGGQIAARIDAFMPETHVMGCHAKAKWDTFWCAAQHSAIPVLRSRVAGRQVYRQSHKHQGCSLASLHLSDGLSLI